MQIQSNSNVQGGPRRLLDIPRSQLLEADNGSKMQDILDSTSGHSLEEMQSQLSERASQARFRALQGGLLTGATALAAGVFAPLTSTALMYSAGAVGLAGLGLVAVGLTRAYQAENASKFLEEKASGVDAKCTEARDGKIHDRRFFTAGALQSASEVSDEKTGQVLERTLQVGGLHVHEDVASGQIRLQSGDVQNSFAGSLQLPSRRHPFAQIVHTLAKPIEELNQTELTFAVDGRRSLAVVGPTEWDEDGMSWEPGTHYEAGRSGFTLGSSNTLEFEQGNGTVVIQSPLEISSFEATSELLVAQATSLAPMEASWDGTPPPPPAPERLPMASYLQVQGQTAKMLDLRAQAAQRYLEAETRYASMQAHASSLDGPKAEVKDLAASWQLLPARPELDQIGPVQSPAESAQLTNLQLSLLAAKSQGQQVFDRAGSLRDGLYVAKGPREAGAQLVQDAKVELARVEALLRAQSAN